ncbi:MAG: hypothetical protein ACI8UO_005173 [Verrucomicrobiales bacterium]|jgi:hypothetical protein
MGNNVSETPKDPNEKEVEFKQFMSELLRAFKHEIHRDRDHFTRRSLHKILTKLCDIIQDSVEAQSCTIHLQIYDPEILGETRVGAAVERMREERAKRLASSPDETTQNIDYTDTSAFPYWFKPKGAMKLAACSALSPWNYILSDNYKDHDQMPGGNLDIVPIDAGISTAIVQDNIAQVRNRLSIVGSRNGVKIGFADRWIWNNQHNLYGYEVVWEGDPLLKPKGRGKPGNEIPHTKPVIRITTTGADAHVVIESTDPEARDPRRVFDLDKIRLLETIGEQGGAEPKALQPWQKHKLRAHIAEQIDKGEAPVAFSSRRWPNIFKDYYGVPIKIHLDGEVLGILKIENKLDVKGLRILRAFRNQTYTEIKEIRSELASKPSCDKWPEKLRKLYRDEGGRSQESDSPSCYILDLASFLHVFSRLHVEDAKNDVDSVISRQYRHFDRKNSSPKKVKPPKESEAELKKRSLRLVGTTFHLSAATTIAHDKFIELVRGNPKNTSRDVALNRIVKLLNRAQEVQDGDAGGAATMGNEPPFERLQAAIEETILEGWNVEFSAPESDQRSKGPATDNGIDFRHVKIFQSVKNNDKPISLYAYRISGKAKSDATHDEILATLIQCLLHSIPFKKFDDYDTRKLSWAALEIGTLIERELAYKASNLSNPIPLTSIEFQQLPIVDMCFIDQMEKRRREAQTVKKNIDHHLQNFATNVGLTEFVDYESRIKDEQSQLRRLGARYAGHRRGSIAAWVYLLALRIEKMTWRKPKKNDSKALKNTFDFLKNLGRFQKLVERFVPSAPLLGQTRELAKNLNIESFIGDLSFASPPILDTLATGRNCPERFNSRLSRTICQNLSIHGGDEFCAPIDAPAKIREIRRRGPKSNDTNRKAGGPASNRLLKKLIFRSYDPYLIDGASLLLQATSLSKNVNDRAYNRFYKAMYDMRVQLSESADDVQTDPALRKLKEIFESDDSTWDNLFDYLTLHSTKEFTDSLEKLAGENQFSEKEKDYLFLTYAGIYKRMRACNSTLVRQRRPDRLDWELEKFDLIGTRFNCLYKNSVFALYETAWNLGDPFTTDRPNDVLAEGEFNYPLCPPSSPKPGKSPGAASNDADRGRRLRWINLRTNVKAGEYNAYQIAMLADPEQIRIGYWNDKGERLNMRVLTDILDLLNRNYPGIHGNSDRQFSAVRQNLAAKYLRWFKIMADIAKERPHNSRFGDKGRDKVHLRWFGSFFLESAIDYRLWLLNKKSELKVQDEKSRKSATGKAKSCFKKAIDALNVEIQELIDANSLKKLVEFGEAYSKTLPFGPKESAMTALFRELGEGESDFDFRVNMRLQPLYDGLLKDYGYVRESMKRLGPKNPLLFPDDEEFFKQGLAFLDREEKYYEVFKSDREGGQMNPFKPLFWIDSDISKELWNKIEALRLDKNDRTRKEVLEEIKNAQSKYLFDTEAVTRHRGKPNVLGRIKTLLYLQDPEANKKAEDPRRKFNSYQLYHYVQKLIPIEVQIRTQLADTIAEHYHDTVYKGRTPSGLEFIKERLSEVGRAQDDLDESLEIDYEDMMGRWLSSLECDRDGTK